MSIRIGLLGLLVLRAVFAQVPILSDDDVNEALKVAKQPRFESLYVEARGPVLADFSVLLQGPMGRLMDVAREVHESYKPFAATNVPRELKVRHVTVLLVMHDDGRRFGIKNVVVMPSGALSRDAAIQPLPSARGSYELGVATPRTWKPGYGWRPAGLPVAYRFAESELPAGDLQLIVITDNGEVRYTVRAADRQRIW